MAVRGEKAQVMYEQTVHSSGMSKQRGAWARRKRTGTVSKQRAPPPPLGPGPGPAVLRSAPVAISTSM